LITFNIVRVEVDSLQCLPSPGMLSCARKESSLLGSLFGPLAALAEELLFYSRKCRRNACRYIVWNACR